MLYFPPPKYIVCKKDFRVVMTIKYWKKFRVSFFKRIQAKALNINNSSKYMISTSQAIVKGSTTTVC